MLLENKKRLLNRKVIITLLIFLVVLGLVLPLQKTQAQFVDIMNIFNAMFEGVEEKAAPLAKEIVQVFVAYVVGLVSLWTSAHLLQLVIVEQSTWLTIQTSAFVQAGWSFISGLANLFLILIFVVIAIAFLLKIETFQAKKALPRLIIVALLLNFGLVFIGALVDISNVLYNTILAGNEEIITQYIDQLGAGANDVMNSIALWIALLVGLFIVPIAGPFAQLAFVIIVVGAGFLPNIMTWIFQIVLFLLISGIFFTWTFLFAARVFVIQILAVLSPLAFVCLILPQTRKHWDLWMKTLVGWIFLGMFLLFFLVLGLRVADTMVPAGGLTPIPFLSWGSVATYFTYYFFMFIYLILVAWVSKAFMPALASFMISQATGWGRTAWQRGARPFAKIATKSVDRLYKEKAEARLRPWLERRHPVISKAVGGPGAYEASKKKRTAAEKKKISDRSSDDLRKLMEQRPVTTAHRHERSAAMELLAEKGKLRESQRRFLREAISYGADDGPILRAMPHWAPDIGENVREQVERQTPRQFRQKVQPEALGSAEVFTSMELKKLQDIEKYGSTAQKDAIRELISTNRRAIGIELRALRTTPGREEEYERALDTFIHAVRSPTFYRRTPPPPPPPAPTPDYIT